MIGGGTSFYIYILALSNNSFFNANLDYFRF